VSQQKKLVVLNYRGGLIGQRTPTLNVLTVHGSFPVSFGAGRACSLRISVTFSPS
jgi:hypothetical protein